MGKMVAANLWCVAGGLILLPFVLRRRIFCSFFILWILPGILFQLVVGYGNVAHCLVYGVSYSAILAIVSSQAKPWKYLAIALNSLIFFLWPHLPSDNLVNYSVNYISPFYQNLRARDVTTAQVLDLIKANPEMDIISIRDRRGIGEYYEGPGCSVLRWEFQKRSILSLIYLPDRTMTSWFNGTEQISKPAKLSDSVIVVVERGNEKTLDMIGRRWLFRIGETYAGVVPCDELEKSLAGIVIF
ncbi:MAG: hypothetical protein ABIN66_02700 [candidate division WOR-3 bacterium]